MLEFSKLEKAAEGMLHSAFTNIEANNASAKSMFTVPDFEPSKSTFRHDNQAHNITRSMQQHVSPPSIVDGPTTLAEKTESHRRPMMTRPSSMVQDASMPVSSSTPIYDTTWQNGSNAHWSQEPSGNSNDGSTLLPIATEDTSTASPGNSTVEPDGLVSLFTMSTDDAGSSSVEFHLSPRPRGSESPAKEQKPGEEGEEGEEGEDKEEEKCSTYEDQYPTIEEILSKMKASKEDENEWDDDTIYDAICEWDDKFVHDPNWFNEEDTDVKDSLRDAVEVHLVNRKKTNDKYPYEIGDCECGEEEEEEITIELEFDSGFKKELTVSTVTHDAESNSFVMKAPVKPKNKASKSKNDVTLELEFESGLKKEMKISNLKHDSKTNSFSITTAPVVEPRKPKKSGDSTSPVNDEITVQLEFSSGSIQEMKKERNITIGRVVIVSGELYQLIHWRLHSRQSSVELAHQISCSCSFVLFRTRCLGTTPRCTSRRPAKQRLRACERTVPRWARRRPRGWRNIPVSQLFVVFVVLLWSGFVIIYDS